MGSQPRPPVRAIVLLGGDLPRRNDLDATWPGWDRDAAFVVAADGGARAAEPLGLTLDLIVSDADTLTSAELAAFAERGIGVRVVPAAKDATDAELAVEAALEAGATALTLVGALGGARLDHELANLALLALEELGPLEATVVDGTTRVRLVSAPGPGGGPVRLALDGRSGDLVSLVPFGEDVLGVTTIGLAWTLVEASLRLGTSRGVSNVRSGPAAAVSVRSGRLLVVEALPPADGLARPDRGARLAP